VNHLRFRGPVYPGERLIMAKMTRCRRGKIAEFTFQGYVGDRLVFDGELIGVPLTREQMESVKNDIAGEVAVQLNEIEARNRRKSESRNSETIRSVGLRFGTEFPSCFEFGFFSC
jgi:hypothetical protein